MPVNTRGTSPKYDEALKYTPNWKELKEPHEVLTKQAT